MGDGDKTLHQRPLKTKCDAGHSSGAKTQTRLNRLHSVFHASRNEGWGMAVLKQRQQLLPMTGTWMRLGCLFSDMTGALDSFCNIESLPWVGKLAVAQQPGVWQGSDVTQLTPKSLNPSSSTPTRRRTSSQRRLLESGSLALPSPGRPIGTNETLEAPQPEFQSPSVRLLAPERPAKSPRMGVRRDGRCLR